MKRDRLYVNTLRVLREKNALWAERCIDTTQCTAPLVCAIMAIKSCLKGKAVLGIDPGERVGVALTVNNLLIYEWEGTREELASVIDILRDVIDIIVVGLGGNDIEINEFRKPIIKVEEGETSTKTVRFKRRVGRHTKSAYLIALRKPITSLQGYMRGPKNELRLQREEEKNSRRHRREARS